MGMIGGPTGSGKTDLALEVAKRRGWEILSADSGQSRRGLEVGTASPTGPQRERIRHHLVGDLDPQTPDSVVSFLDRTEAVLASSGPDILVVGGTCQYLEALSRGMDAVPPPDAAVREVLAQRLQAEGHAALWNELQSREKSPPPDAAQNPVRLLRALEKSIQTERGFLGESRTALAPNAPLVALAWPRDLLHRRLGERLDAMLIRGWLEEVKALMETCPADAPAWRCIGFQPLREVLEGRQDLPQAKARILEATRQYAKRQETFLRNRLAPRWIEGNLGLGAQADHVESTLK